MRNGVPPRVLHVAEVVKGGVGTALTEIVRHQREALGPENLALVLPAPDARELGVDDLPNLYTFARGRRGILATAGMTRALLAAYRDVRPHLVHAHSTWAGAAVRGTAGLASPRPAVVFSPQGWAFAQAGSLLRRRAYAAAERALAGATDSIVNVSHAERAAAETWGLPPEKMVVIRNGVSPTGPTSPPPPCLDPDRLNLLFVGRLDRQKGFDVLLGALELLRDEPIRLWVAGAADRERARHAWPDNAVALGWLRRAEVDAWYAGADAVVLPSRWEGLPFVALEAMRNGTPVVASDIPVLAEAVRHGREGYLVPVDDVAAWASRLRELDRATLRRMGSAAYRRYLSDFTARRMNEELLDLYRGLLTSPARPTGALQGA